MNAFLLSVHGLSIALYVFVVWRYVRVHRSEMRLLDQLQEQGSVPTRTRPILFATVYGAVTLFIAVARSALFAFQPHWL